MKNTVLTLLTLVTIFSCNQEDVVQDELQSTSNNNELLLSGRGECRFDKSLNNKLKTSPEFETKFAINEARVADLVKRMEEDSKTSRPKLKTLTIKVVVNNVYRTSPLSMDVIEGQIEQLNNAFAGRLDRVKGIPANGGRFNAGNTKIKFVLEDVKFRRNQKIFRDIFDLFKRSTGGIDPTNSSSSINIYVANIIEATDFELFTPGDAAFPDSVDAEFDHVFIDNLAFGVKPGGDGFLNEGKLLAHEMGHYFGLFHLPGRTTNSCRFDDAIGDTPNSSSNNNAPDLSPGRETTTCGSQDMYWNLMTLANDSQRFMFTNGQRNRMRAILNGTRNNFVTK